MQLVHPIPPRTPARAEKDPGVQRPFALRGARRLSSFGPTLSAAQAVYDPVTQTASRRDGTPLVAMATSQKTSQDGDIKNPPRSDEGSDPGVFER